MAIPSEAAAGIPPQSFADISAGLFHEISTTNPLGLFPEISAGIYSIILSRIIPCVYPGFFLGFS